MYGGCIILDVVVESRLMKIVELKRVSMDRIGRVNKNGVKLYPHEDSTALHLTQFGFDVEYIMPRHIYKSTNPDFLVNGTIWETKSPEGNGKNTIKHQFDGTSKQADKIILDLRRIKLPAEKAERQAMARFEKAINIKRLLLITKSGRVLDIRR